MRIESLACLIELEKAGSINAAAKNLFISQQGLSRTLGSLEDELDAKLVDRTHHGVHFTEAGCLALVHAKAIVQEFDLMKRGIVRLSEESLVIPIELVVSPYATITLLDRVMGSVSRASLLSTDEWSKSQIRRQLEEGGAASLFLYDWIADPSSRTQGDGYFDESAPITFKPLRSSRFGLMCRKGTLGNHGGSISVDDAARLQLVSFKGRDYQQTLEEVLGPECFRNVTFKVSNRNALTTFVKANDRTGMLLDSFSFSAGPTRSEALEFIPFDDVPLLTVGFAFANDDPKAANYLNFIEHLRRTENRKDR